MFFDPVIEEHYSPEEYPALGFLTDKWSQSTPFEGLKILVATPVYRNTFLQYKALMAGGAKLVVGHSATVPGDSKSIAFLKQHKIPVIDALDIKKGLASDDFDLILDCGGQFSFCKPKKGFVELTRSGVPLFENSTYPVYVADSGIVKRIETSLGTGEGYFRALEWFGHKDFENKNLVVFGSGKVGCGIALQGRSRGMEVTTITNFAYKNSSSDFTKVLENNHVLVVDYLDENALKAVNNCHYLVTATGVKNMLAEPVVSILMNNPNIIAANMGVEDEFGLRVPFTRVLNHKKTLNFILEEPTHLKYIDASLALHCALGERLLENIKAKDCFKGLRPPDSDIEQQLLVTTIQNGVIGEEICAMLH